MSKRTYAVLIVVTLAIFSVSLIWPEFMLGALSRLIPAPTIFEIAAPRAQESETGDATPDQKKAFRLQDINFDVSDEEKVEAAQADAQAQKSETATTTAALVSNENHLTIPRIGVNADVIIADTDAALRKGLWHIPGSALPGSDGNIVISAHRWLHKPPNPTTFYSIDKIQVGDPIYYDYRGSRYEYRVTKHFIVNPDDVYILNQDENKLTLFTCTPLYSTKQRYVVNAELISVTPFR